VKQKYRHTFRCPDCSHKFRRVTFLPADEQKNIPCPECKKKKSYHTPAIGDGAVSDSDLVEQKVFIQSDKYHCEACKRYLIFHVEKEGDQLSNCYRCGSQNVTRCGMYMPNILKSNKDMIKAVDIVAEEAMKSYGMTDLNMGSNMKPGDTCAPKLPPAQQQMADNFFNQGKNPSLKGMNLGAMGKRAIAGAYRDPTNPVAMAHKARLRPGTEGNFVDATPGRRR
jgi:transcription elongation factor Elf1